MSDEVDPITFFAMVSANMLIEDYARDGNPLRILEAAAICDQHGIEPPAAWGELLWAARKKLQRELQRPTRRVTRQTGRALRTIDARLLLAATIDPAVPRVNAILREVAKQFGIEFESLKQARRRYRSRQKAIGKP